MESVSFLARRDLESLVATKIELERALDNLKRVTSPVIYSRIVQHINLITSNITNEIVRLKMKEE